MEEAALLLVHRVVGGVEVEDEFLGRRIEGGDEARHQDLVDTPRPGPAGGVSKRLSVDGLASARSRPAAVCKARSKRRAAWSLTSS